MARSKKYVLSLPAGLLLSLGLLLFTTPGFSQVKIKGSVKGAIVDTAGKQILSDATVSASPDADTNAAQFVVTNKKGAFLVRNLSPGKYHLLISFEGYQTLSRSFYVAEDSSGNNIDMGTLYMQRSNEEMEAVIVSRPPITVKKDTVEYLASMFATKPNAVAEDLLKKMPGVQVDKNGNITAQGETVSRILVDGKRFFSDDPKLATRNLPPDVIDKIQVFDDLSDQSKFTGFDDGNRVKTINIITKKDKRKGYFGKMVAGVGSDENYDESLNLHRFDGNQQMSLLGQANNINKQNFTPQDILGSSGGRRGGGGGGGGGGASTATSNTGVTTVWAGGLNYKNSFGTKTDVYGSYFYNFQHVSVNTNDSTLRFNKNQENEDSISTSTGGSSSIQRIQSHRINLNIEHRFDSSNSLIFRPNVTISQSTPDASYNTLVTDSSGAAFSNSVGHSSSINSGFNINNANLQFRHKFNKAFRTISLDVNTTANVNNGTGLNYAINSYYQRNEVDTLNQFYNDSLHSITLSPTLSYTEPIAKNQILEFNYNHTYTKSTTINNTYDFVDSLHTFKSFDSLFSNSYKFVSNADRFTLNYRIQNAKYNLSLGSGLQYTGFTSDNITKNITVAHNYVNLTPTVNFQYLFSQTSRLRLNYSGRTGTPTPAQLQPLTTTSDERSFQIGNPELKPQFTHSLRMLFASFNPGNQRVIFATINASTTVNDIQSAVFYNTKGGQTSTYVNLNGTYSVSGYFNYGFALKKPKSNLNLITNINYAQSQTLQASDSAGAANNEYYHRYSRNTTLSQTISWTTNIKKNFDMNFSSTSQYNINNPSGGLPVAKTGQSSQSQGNLNSFSQIFSAEITAYTNSGWLIATNFDYTYTNTGAAGYNASVPLLTPSIAKQLFKKKNGELRLTVFDLLNSNTSVSKTVSATQAAYSRTNVLTRYAMLTFTYNLNNFAGSQQKRMPGMFPGRFRGVGGGRGGGGGGFGGDGPLP